jgi:hypothetical protein
MKKERSFCIGKVNYRFAKISSKWICSLNKKFTTMRIKEICHHCKIKGECDNLLEKIDIDNQFNKFSVEKTKMLNKKYKIQIIDEIDKL